MNRKKREIKPTLNQPTKAKWSKHKLTEEKGVVMPIEKQEISEEELGVILAVNLLKSEIKRVNAILRETHNPHEYRQNKKRLERLERELRKLNVR